MASYQGESTNNNPTGLKPARKMPPSDHSRQPSPQVSSTPPQGQGNPYMSKYRTPERPAYEPEPTAGAPAKPRAEFRTSAVHDGNDLEDFHRAQEDHYRRKGQPKQQQPADLTDPNLGWSQYDDRPAMNTNGFPRFPTDNSTPPPTEDFAAANDKATRRKPVPVPDPKISPLAPPHTYAVPAEELGLHVLVQHSEPAAAGAQQYIGRRGDGKFSSRQIHQSTTPPTHMEMPKPSFEADPSPPRGRAADMPMPKGRLDADDHDPSDRTVRPGISRRDSSSSMHSLSEGIKRIGSRVRRGSAEFFENFSKAASLAAKHPSDRKKYENAKIKEKRESARERSAERHANPELRPVYERTALRQKKFEIFEQERREVIDDAESRAQAEEQDAPYHRANQTQGVRPQPELEITLSPEERQALRDANMVPKRKESPPLDKWEERGNNFGKVFDPFRRKRSDDSNIGFDAPCPQGSMTPCSRCNQEPANGILKHDLCEDCREAAKHEKKR